MPITWVLEVEQQLLDDATARGWDREVERHIATKTRIEGLLAELDAHDDSAPTSEASSRHTAMI